MSEKKFSLTKCCKCPSPKKDTRPVMQKGNKQFHFKFHVYYLEVVRTDRIKVLIQPDPFLWLGKATHVHTKRHDMNAFLLLNLSLFLPSSLTLFWFHLFGFCVFIVSVCAVREW